jgi:spore germination protein GerM
MGVMETPVKVELTAADVDEVEKVKVVVEGTVSTT